MVGLWWQNETSTAAYCQILSILKMKKILVGHYLFSSIKFCVGQKHLPSWMITESVLLDGVSFLLSVFQLCWDMQALKATVVQCK